RHYRRKRYYTTAQRILIHLSAEDGGPEARTQDGIAASTMSGRPTVTKWLAMLEERGLLLRERARLPGYELPKFVYRLSDPGWRQAEQLQSRLTSEMVEVHSPSLGTLSMRIPDVPALVSPPLNLVAAVSLIHQGRLDLTSVPPTASRTGESLVWGSLRQVDHLFGRGQELRILDGWYESRGSVLLVTGLAGIGKSALVAGWIQRRRPRAHVFVFQLHRSTKASGLLSDFGAFLATLGRRNLSAHLSQGGALDFPFVERLLARDLGRLPILVVIDSLEQASRDVVRFIRGPLLRVTQSTPTKLILLSRRVPAWTVPPGKVTPIEVMRLRGLDSVASGDLLRHRGFAADEKGVRDIVASTRGHPLLLHLAVQGASGRVSTIQEYFEKELWGALSTEERTALETASIFRRGVVNRILETAAGVRRRVIEDLRLKNLLEQTVSGAYLLHDLVREFLHSRMDEQHVRELHDRASRPLLREREPRNRWEGVYHLIMANRMTEAAAYLESEGAPLLDSVAAEEIASLVRGLSLEQMDWSAACVFSEVVGDSLNVLGHIGPALFQYGHAMRMAEDRSESSRVPRLLRKMAFLERCRGRYARALGYAVEAQARLSQVHKPKELIEVLREIALVEQAMGDLSKAVAHLNEAVDLATDASDGAALSRTLLALGSLETQRGHRERGLQYNLEGLRVAQRSGNLTEVARAHIVVGTGLAELERLEESLAYHDQGLEIAQLLGNLRLTAYATLNRAGALVDLGRYEDAGSVLREAQGYFGILEERDTLGLLKVYEGNRERGLGRWTRAQRAWEEGLATLREYGSPVDLVRALREVGGYHVEHGDSTDGRTYLLEAEGIARKLGNATLLSEIRGDLSRISPAAPSLEKV
ncbi:MAG: tetratricopeptide repeat protein, partial [Thermoplasmata archaeon]